MPAVSFYVEGKTINNYNSRNNNRFEAPINDQIRDREVRVFGADGQQLGVMPIEEARKAAEDAELDLVLIAANAKPPVCKIIDYSK